MGSEARSISIFSLLLLNDTVVDMLRNRQVVPCYLMLLTVYSHI